MNKIVLFLTLLLAGCAKQKPCPQATSMQSMRVEKVKCIWQSYGHGDLEDHHEVCITSDGIIRGRVYHLIGGDWQALYNNAYCADGANFITREAALHCVNKFIENDHTWSDK